MRIYELAKNIKLSNKEIIVKLAGLGITVKSHMSNVDDSTAKKLIEIFTNEGKVKSGTKLAAPKKKEKAAKPAAPRKTAAAKKPVKPKNKADKAPSTERRNI
jgi:translation initiation factor IF-2